MSYGIYLSAAGMQVQDYRQNVMASNLANAETPGFKHDLAVFSERPVESRGSAGGWARIHPLLDNLPGGTFVTPTVHALIQGPLENTGQELDAAINGEGYFAVQDGDETRYTRDGRFAFNRVGELVLAVGEGRLRVLNTEGEPILRIEGGGETRVDPGGVVRQGNQPIGQIGVFAFEEPDRLRKAGENLFTAGDVEPTVGTGRILPQTLERSTFDPIHGLEEMIKVQRAYQLNAKMLTLQDESIGQSIGTVGRYA